MTKDPLDFIRQSAEYFNKYNITYILRPDFYVEYFCMCETKRKVKFYNIVNRTPYCNRCAVRSGKTFKKQCDKIFAYATLWNVRIEKCTYYAKENRKVVFIDCSCQKKSEVSFKDFLKFGRCPWCGKGKPK